MRPVKEPERAKPDIRFYIFAGSGVFHGLVALGVFRDDPENLVGVLLVSIVWILLVLAFAPTIPD